MDMNSFAANLREMSDAALAYDRTKKELDAMKARVRFLEAELAEAKVGQKRGRAPEDSPESRRVFLRPKKSFNVFDCEATFAIWVAATDAISWDFDIDTEGSIKRGLDVLNRGDYSWLYDVFDYRGGVAKPDSKPVIKEFLEVFLTHKDLDNGKRHFLMAAFIVGIVHQRRETTATFASAVDTNQGKTQNWADIAYHGLGRKPSMSQRFDEFFKPKGVFSKWLTLVDLQLLSDTLRHEPVYYQQYTDLHETEEEIAVRQAFKAAGYSLPTPSSQRESGYFTDDGW